jgi:glycosyltransferase involved in cell wall biosynthesis
MTIGVSSAVTPGADNLRRGPTIVAVVPALNEAPSIGQVVARLHTAAVTEESARGLAASLSRVIVVDNGSTDGTGELARAAGADVVREARRGYGRACLAGVLAAHDANIIVLLDGDAADEPADLPRLLGPLLGGAADLVVGSRTLGAREPGAMTPQQVAGNWLAARLMGRLYGIAVTDLGPFRALRRADLLALDMREMTYGWSVEMMVKAARVGYRYAEVPVAYHRRIGVSKVGGTVRGSLRAGWCILATVVRYARWSPAPARGHIAEGRR